MPLEPLPPARVRSLLAAADAKHLRAVAAIMAQCGHAKADVSTFPVRPPPNPTVSRRMRCRDCGKVWWEGDKDGK